MVTYDFNTQQWSDLIAGDIVNWAPVFTRDIGSQEIYALTMKWP